eukprot:253097_1
MGECQWGIVWSFLNLIIGIVIITANIFWAFDGNACGWFTICFGILIVWVTITTKFCEDKGLAWFPLWGNFLFMGCTFLYLGCGAWLCLNPEDCDWWGFFFFFIFIVGVLYVIFWLVKTFAGVNIPDPVPLASLCGGDGGGGYQKMDG